MDMERRKGKPAPRLDQHHRLGFLDALHLQIPVALALLLWGGAALAQEALPGQTTQGITACSGDINAVCSQVTGATHITGTLGGAGGLTMGGTLTGADSGTWGSGGINGSIIGATTAAAGTFTNSTSTGYGAVTGTSLPTQAAGTLGLGGEATAPTLGANGEGDVYLTSTTGGLTLIGKGSTNDLTILNDGGTSACVIATGSTTLNCVGLSENGTALGTAATKNTGTSGGTVPLLNAANTFSASQTFTATVAAAFGANGGNTGAVQFNGSTSGNFDISASATGTPQMTGLPNAAENEILCYNSSTSAISYENSVAGCVPSALRFKNLAGFISSDTTTTGIEALRPAVWRYKDAAMWGTRPYVGLLADDVAKMDARCVDYDKDGKLENYEDRCVIAYLVGTVQKQQREIDRLSRRR